MSCLIEYKSLIYLTDNSKLQHAFMHHLSNHGYKCSKPFQTKSGDTYVRHESDKSDFLLQVLSFLPGDSINSLKFDKEDFLKMCYLSGENLARLHLLGQVYDMFYNAKALILGVLQQQQLADISPLLIYECQLPQARVMFTTVSVSVCEP